MAQVHVTNQIWRIPLATVVTALGLDPVIEWGWDGRFIVTQHAQTVENSPPGVPSAFDLLTDHWTKTLWEDVRLQWFSHLDPILFERMAVWFDADYMYIDLQKRR